MKQFDVKSEKTIGDNTFYVRPFPAFVSANMSGELAALVMPILTSLTPMLAGGVQDGASALDLNAEVAGPALANGLAALSGDKVERLMKKLLTTHGNVSVELSGAKDAQKLTEDLANEIFCGDVQDMFILAFEVIKVNFSGFFKKIGTQFGPLLSVIQKG